MDGEGREVLFALVNPPADFEVRKPDILKRLTGLTPKDLMLPSAVQEVQEMVRQKVQGCIWWVTTYGMTFRHTCRLNIKLALIPQANIRDAA